MEKTVISIVESYKAKLKSGSIFFAPNVPPKKLKNALNVYAGKAVFEEILVLIDCTVFGSAKDGVLITNERIYAHDTWGESNSYLWKDIDKIAFKPDDEDKVQINEIDFFTTIGLDRATVEKLIEMVEEILRLVSPEKFTSKNPQENVSATNQLSAIEALRELKKLYDEGILTQEEFQTKKQKYLDLL
jgi:hypothetical protein